ncbi:MAG TPA: Crp/Fnr family transcriptional regulator [Candidatus Nanopelagicales bacterium]
MSTGLQPSLEPATEDALLRAGRPRQFCHGEVVFHQGDPCDTLFLLRRGRVTVHAVTPEGDMLTVGLMSAPDAFGEVGLIRADHHHTATVIAVDEVHVLGVLAERFHQVRHEHPDLNDWLLVTLTQRLERTMTLLSESLYLDAEHRVVRRLLDCRRSFGVDADDSLPLTQDDLAAMAGVTRPTANRVLRRLADQAVVELGRGHIHVLDLARLEAAAR